MSLIVDKDRFQEVVDGAMSQTGIFVRAFLNDKVGSYDVITLTKDSLLEWLRSRDENPDDGVSWREQVIMVVFGHPR